MKDLILAIDAGTTSVRCIAFTIDGMEVASVQSPLTQYYPGPGMVEHDPEEIRDLCIDAIHGCLEQVGPERVLALGITNQRETTILWDRHSGKPVSPAIVWQDRRTASRCEELRNSELCPHILSRTGLHPDAYFSATKAEHIMKENPGLAQRALAGDLLFGTVDSWILWNITVGNIHATDCTNASRTMLFDIHKMEWDVELMAEFGIHASMLPVVRGSSSVFGTTDREILGVEVPVAAIIGDQQSALFGQACLDKGDVKITFGTGGFLLMNTGNVPVMSDKGLLSTISWGIDGNVSYAIEGSVYVAGAAVQWLRDELGIIDESSETEMLADSVPDAGGCFVVPAFTGLGAPYWDQDAKGAILGITRGTTRAHLARAVLESLAYQVNDVIDAMTDGFDLKVNALKVDGGASRNNFLCRFLADITGLKVIRPRCIESTALGVSLMAGLTMGVWHSLDELRDRWQQDACFEPMMSEDDRERLVCRWHHAVRCARMWTSDC